MQTALKISKHQFQAENGFKLSLNMGIVEVLATVIQLFIYSSDFFSIFSTQTDIGHNIGYKCRLDRFINRSSHLNTISKYLKL